MERWSQLLSSVVPISVLHSLQGLEAPVAQWLTQCRFTAPCVVTLALPHDLASEDLQAGIETALHQLSSVLPPGSVVRLTDPWEEHWEALYPPACAAIAAAGAALTHIDLYPPAAPGTDACLGRLLQEQPPRARAVLDRLESESAHARAAWPWQRLCVYGCYMHQMEDLLQLPDPSAGQYEIEIGILTLDLDEVWHTRHGTSMLAHMVPVCSPCRTMRPVS